MSEGTALTNQQSEDEQSSGKRVIRIASVAALGGLLFGYDSAVINGAVTSIQAKETKGMSLEDMGKAASIEHPTATA